MTITAVSPRRLLQDRQDREHLAEYRAAGGYAPPRVAAGDLVAEIAGAGLRGRGGAAFSTAAKWRSVAGAAAPRHVVVNAEEGEPVSRKDRWLLIRRPHLVLEGALLAAAAVTADHVWVYVSDAEAAQAMRTAIGELEADESLHRPPGIDVVTTGHTYVAGEETAAVRAIGGGPALPMTKPPRPFEAGVRGQPTLVQNAETLAHVTLIARRGAAWFKSVGTAASPGTFLLTLAGDCAAPGLFEVELGTPLRVPLAWAAGPRRAPEPGGFLFGGYFGGLIGRRAIDLPLEYDLLRAEGVGLGCGAITVIGSHRCMVGVATAALEFYARQSASQCGVCVRGTQALRDTARRLHAGIARGDEAQSLARYANTVRGRGACALPDGAANIVTSLLREFPEAVRAHLAGRCARCPGDARELIPVLPAAAVPAKEGASR